ncbi:MAG: KipI antagonist, partial [Chloroflexi bacterium]
MIEVVEAGRWTTIQDLGRPGLERYGIPSGGAADWFAATVANRIVGNAQDAALLECTAAGPTLRFDADAIVALTGGHSPRVPTWQVLRSARGSSLTVGAIAP